MWRSNLALAVRLMARNRAYAALTIVRLATGLAGTLLILGYVRYERSYDSWLADGDRVHQVQATIRPPGKAEVRMQGSSAALDSAMAGAFPQVQAVTALTPGKTNTGH